MLARACGRRGVGLSRDLGSTNGTFVGGKRIDEDELENHSEFRVGEHVLMLIITSLE